MRRMIDNLVSDCSQRRLVPSNTSAHTLRHTFARNYLQDNPGDVIGLATLLGHDSLDTTRIYSQPSTDQLAARVDRLKINAFAGSPSTTPSGPFEVGVLLSGTVDNSEGSSSVSEMGSFLTKNSFGNRSFAFRISVNEPEVGAFLAPPNYQHFPCTAPRPAHHPGAAVAGRS